MRTATVKREALGGELRTVGVVAANERGPGADQRPASPAGSRSCWCPRPASACGAARRWRPSTAPTCCAPSRSCWSRAGWNAGSGGKPTRADAHEHEALAAGLDANARRRLELLGISAQEIDEVLRTGKAVEAIAIRSPVDGYVVGEERGRRRRGPARHGAVRGRGSLAGLGDRGGLRAGHLAHPRRPDGAPGAVVVPRRDATPGKVKFIYPVLDASNRTLRVRLEFKNRVDRNGPRLRPGMYGTVYLDLPADDRPHGPGRGGRRHGRDALPLRREGRRPLRAAPGEGRRARARTTSRS